MYLRDLRPMYYTWHFTGFELRHARYTGSNYEVEANRGILLHPVQR